MRAAWVLSAFLLFSYIADLALTDLLPGWTMYFLDLQRGRDLKIKVTQRAPGELEEGKEWSSWASVTGFSSFALYDEGISGYLIPKEACWSNYSYRDEGEWVEIGSYPEPGTYPESAKVRGIAYMGFSFLPFELDLISYGFPDEKALDRAILTVKGKGIVEEVFLGELHHGVLRALLAPRRPKVKLAVTWGGLKRR